MYSEKQLSIGLKTTRSCCSCANSRSAHAEAARNHEQTMAQHAAIAAEASADPRVDALAKLVEQLTSSVEALADKVDGVTAEMQQMSTRPP